MVERGSSVGSESSAVGSESAASESSPPVDSESPVGSESAASESSAVGSESGVSESSPVGSESARLQRLERKSSIESEPLTLTFEQLQSAREAALYVLNTKTFEEAVHIFTDGLQPVHVRVVRNGVDGADEVNFRGEHRGGSSLLERIRDIATAPF